MQKKILLLLIAGMLLLGSAVALAEDTNTSKNESFKENKTGFKQGIKNMTQNYGQCVSEGAQSGQDCYKATMDKRKSCRDDAKNQTNVTLARTVLKQCSQDYKAEIKQCKTGFKQLKKDCKQIKHSFWEEWGFGFGFGKNKTK